MAQLEPCMIVMEVSGGANYWAREFIALGHLVKLIAPQYVKPYVKGNKNDYNKAQAIAEARQRSSSCSCSCRGVKNCPFILNIKKAEPVSWLRFFNRAKWTYLVQLPKLSVVFALPSS